MPIDSLEGSVWNRRGNDVRENPGFSFLLRRILIWDEGDHRLIR